ncbi:ImmA/IrrE family metallo-endopeptidase [Streptomyces sp. SCA3-4]|uniref:ImmA/IrrE family metallo-endopeptidase n=1 Tax=Streptomyces sichuanensis TaxID=2871810 RepID=UPI001CE2C32F|nr:ImmA/IrrE family metallo-endopeptidase [Streptomyces sichuanensis]MCA6094063.1 ImmA/IrrE family metallo-endopeptidase [Streptomyces sichuanensis]
MHWRRLRRQCEKVIGEIPLPEPFSAQELCTRLAAERSRPLHLLPLPTPTAPGTPSGMWLATERADYVFYDEQTSPLHQEHIIMHEIGHMVCDHRSGIDDLRLYRHIDITDPQSIRQALPRLRYSDQQEQEAEMIATLILEAVGRLPTPSRLSGMLAGLESAMGLRGHRGTGASCSHG